MRPLLITATALLGLLAGYLAGPLTTSLGLATPLVQQASAEGLALDQPTTEGGSEAKDALVGIFRAWGGLQSYRVRQINMSSALGTSEMNIEAVLPDRFHAVGPRMEMIMVGPTIYLKLPTGWQKIGQGLDLNLANPNRMLEDLVSLSDVRFLGPELLDGTPTLVYSYRTTLNDNGSTPLNPMIPREYLSRIWAGAADQLPRKIESSDLGETFKTNATYYDFNAPISIEAPI